MTALTPPAAIVDVDGTLVDTNDHHVLAWFRAFRQQGVVVPTWRLHRAVGMGGDNFVGAVAGGDVERERGDDVRAAHDVLYMATIDEIQALPGARDLLEALRQRDVPVVLASSAREDELDRYLDLLDARDLVTAWTTSDDVDRTKPEPDVIGAALERSGAGDAVVLGDSTWDCVAAERAGLRSIGLRCGGFCERDLREAGASLVVEDPVELRRRLDETPWA